MFTIEPVERRSGQVVFLSLSRPESTGSILVVAKLNVMRGLSNPRTTSQSMTKAKLFLDLPSYTAAREVSVLFWCMSFGPCFWLVYIYTVAWEVSCWFSSSVFFFSATGDEVLFGHHTVSDFWDI
jgi:hypothetical protein